MLKRASALALAAALTACGGGGAPRAPGADVPLRLALSTEPHALDPLLSQSIPENEVLRLLYDPLIASDGAGRPVAALAREVPTRRNGGISADGLTIAYRLRRRVRWHDGREFTSADVAESFRALMDPRNTIATRHGYDAVERVETPEKDVVRFRLRRPFAPFVGTAFAESDAPYYVAPAHEIAGRPLARLALSTHPVGTGPYRFVRWVRGDRIELAANDAYWGGRPAIRRIVVRFIPDENAQMVGLRTGELDGVIQISTNAAPQARAIPGVRVVASDVNGYWGVLMNTARGRLRDARVRAAIARALDPHAFVRDVTHGIDALPVADLPRVLWAADPSLTPVPYDPAAARRLLAAAGIDPAHRIELELATIAGRQTYRVESVALQAALRPLGIDVQIHPYVGPIYSAPLAEHGVLSSGHYDLALYGWIAGMDPDDSSQFSCEQRPPAGYDVTFYCSAEMDAAQRAALGSYDETVRRRAYARIERLLLRDAPIAFLGAPKATAALRSEIEGFAPSLVTETASAQRWRRASRF